MVHAFDDRVAMVVGVKGAILLNHIAFWVSRNQASDINFYDGSYWTYNSAQAYAKLFPFWTSNLIQKELKKLEKDGYIKSGYYNKSAMDRTKWYALTDAGAALTLTIQPSGGMESANSLNVDSAISLNGISEFALCTLNSNKRNSREHSNNATRVAVDVPPALADVFAAFEEHRKQMRKPLTEYAKRLILRKLDKLAQTDEQKKAILEQSISRGWLDVFPISNGSYRQQSGQQSAKDMADQAIAMMRESGWINDGAGENHDSADAGGVPSWISEQ